MAQAEPLGEVGGLFEAEAITDFLDGKAGRLQIARGCILPEAVPIDAGGEAKLFPVETVKMGPAQAGFLLEPRRGKRRLQGRFVQTLRGAKDPVVEIPYPGEEPALASESLGKIDQPLEEELLEPQEDGIAGSLNGKIDTNVGEMAMDDAAQGRGAPFQTGEFARVEDQTLASREKIFAGGPLAEKMD